MSGLARGDQDGQDQAGTHHPNRARRQYVYGSGSAGKLTPWQLAADCTIVPTPVAQTPLAFTHPGAIPVVSSDGADPASAVLWTVDQTDGATLRAFAAADVSERIRSSALDPARDGLAAGGFDHFSGPATADRLVMVGDQRSPDVYGRISG